MDNTFSERVARRVRSVMDAAGMSQNELADRSGIARVTLRRRLDGHSAFTLNESERIAAALGTSLDELLLGAVA
ncbi:MAG TPA: helix-turn-helix transcriptional regulator [Nocardioides sp.]